MTPPFRSSPKARPMQPQAGFMFAMTGPLAGRAPPAALFYYSRDRAGSHVHEHLEGWTGILQADAYSGSNKLYSADREPAPFLEARAGHIAGAGYSHLLILRQPDAPGRSMRSQTLSRLWPSRRSVVSTPCSRLNTLSGANRQKSVLRSGRSTALPSSPVSTRGCGSIALASRATMMSPGRWITC
jgi:hypothetical protein